jgi:hypothetical protein
MRIIRFFLLSLGLLALSLPAFAANNESVNLRAILVSASKQPGKTDPSLSPYESTLRRILRFESFKQLGTDQARAQIPGKGALSISSGQIIEFSTENSKDDRLRVQITWKSGNRTLMRTGLALRPGVPAVLGGPARNDDEVFAVILIAQ